MKLRIKGNSIRIRLDRRDIERLVRESRVVDAINFGPGLEFSYSVEVAPTPRERPEVAYGEGRITLRIDPADAIEWLEGDRVGFDHKQAVNGGSIRVLLEKDFACIDRPAGEEDDDAFAFPNPSLTC
ncbi:DUF7009 family protein [Singulisphaera rosea]